MRRLALGAALTAPLLILVPSATASATPNERIERHIASIETPGLFDDDAGGEADADDPAIWIHPTDRARSLVIGAVKNGGLRVYDLKGREVQAIPAPAAPGPDDEPGRFNNVDLLTGFRLGGRKVDLAVVTDRGRDQLRFYQIDPDPRPGQAPLVDVTASDVPFAFSADQGEVNEQTTAYGVATYTSLRGESFVVATRRHTTTIGLFRVVAAGNAVSYQRVDLLDFPERFQLPNGADWQPCEDPGEEPQLEGLTIDPVTGALYAAQEDIALWRLSVLGGQFSRSPRVIEYTREFGVPATFDPVEEECVYDFDADPGFGGRIASDVEGLTIFRTGLLGGTLVVSSQGDNTFFTYDRLTNRPLDHFEIADGTKTDGVQDCDGAAVVNVPLPGFPNGLLVVHDGENTPDVLDEGGETRANTNFKYLDAGFLKR